MKIIGQFIYFLKAACPYTNRFKLPFSSPLDDFWLIKIHIPVREVKLMKSTQEENFKIFQQILYRLSNNLTSFIIRMSLFNTFDIFYRYYPLVYLRRLQFKIPAYIFLSRVLRSDKIDGAFYWRHFFKKTIKRKIIYKY